MENKQVWYKPDKSMGNAFKDIGKMLLALLIVAITGLVLLFIWSISPLIIIIPLIVVFLMFIIALL